MAMFIETKVPPGRASGLLIDADRIDAIEESAAGGARIVFNLKARGGLAGLFKTLVGDSPRAIAEMVAAALKEALPGTLVHVKEPGGRKKAGSGINPQGILMIEPHGPSGAVVVFASAFDDRDPAEPVTLPVLDTPQELTQKIETPRGPGPR